MENGLVNVANRLFREGIDTHVACLSSAGDFAQKLPRPEQVYVMDKGGSFSPGAAWRLFQTISKTRPHLIHTHNLGPLIYGSLASAFGARVPILHGEHGQIQRHEQNSKRRWQRRLLYATCRRIHTVSKSMIQALKEEGLPIWKVTAIVNGVDSERYQPAADRAAARTSLELPHQALVIGVVGRFVGLKRHLALLEALKTVMAASPELYLLVAGDQGDSRDAVVAAMQAHPFATRIRWLGMKSDMLPVYQALDLLVSPSEIEGLSNVVLEAMACGVPVLAHHACGNSEVITPGVNGFCEDLSTPSHLAAALTRCLVRPETLLQAGKSAREHVMQHFSLDSMALGYLRLYQECAS
jgi:glycosyltransferase involved in cell wall biosynthesis